MELNEILQWTAIAVILVAVIVYMIRKFTRRSGNSGCGCDCGLRDCCKSRGCGVDMLKSKKKGNDK